MEENKLPRSEMRRWETVLALLWLPVHVLGLPLLLLLLFPQMSMANVNFWTYALGAAVLTLSCLLFVSASYTPLPGASGAQEGGFLLYFKGIFRDGTIGLALLIWRFFTYYLFLIAGVFAVLGEKVLLKAEQGRKKHTPGLDDAGEGLPGNAGAPDGETV